MTDALASFPPRQNMVAKTTSSSAAPAAPAGQGVRMLIPSFGEHV
eukprot:CAMPEP_0197733216 /NCGR_PEP_ID=MMETSP1434-20131217/43160_1 /TAXON_ID=265543 /ORGANISM="Minutocellus polymorphus, Strain CCMP3303" /LENGTH=44 /DNA_ID= /DNA_START= /DNA_END= /DNA_ORIENTATION=